MVVVVSLVTHVAPRGAHHCWQDISKSEGAYVYSYIYKYDTFIYAHIHIYICIYIAINLHIWFIYDSYMIIWLYVHIIYTYVGPYPPSCHQEGLTFCICISYHCGFLFNLLLYIFLKKLSAHQGFQDNKIYLIFYKTRSVAWQNLSPLAKYDPKIS